MLWTTEKEQLFIVQNSGFFGTKAGGVLQVTDVDGLTLNNVITFPPSGVFFVRSGIEIASHQRVNFRFDFRLSSCGFAEERLGISFASIRPRMLTSSYGNTFHSSERVESGQFAFTTAEAGDYMACFWVDNHKPPATLTVDFDWKTGVSAKDWSTVAKKGSIDTMELELKTLMDTVNSIHEEMFYLRDREEEMQTLNASANSKMFWLSFLSLFICLTVAGLQFWHLKSFFERKKLL